MKPDWKDAPEWAQWLANDMSGDWYWFENKPRLSLRSCLWMPEGGDCAFGEAGLYLPNWQDSLEGRPS